MAEGTLFLKSVTIRGMADPPPSLFHPHPFFSFFLKENVLTSGSQSWQRSTSFVLDLIG